MTQIVNLPALTTITNSLIFPAADTSDGNKTKKVTLNQLVALAAGPRGPAGVAGVPGQQGPSGPTGPNANQLLNTTSFVTFQSVSISNPNFGITFGDGTVQKSAYRKLVKDLTEFSTGNVSLLETDITFSIATGNPQVAGRSLYLPAASQNLAGSVIIVRNRSNLHTFDTWAGLTNLATVNIGDSIQIACDGYTWFTV